MLPSASSSCWGDRDGRRERRRDTEADNPQPTGSTSSQPQLDAITKSRRRCGENDDSSHEMYVVAFGLGTRIHDDLRLGQLIETVSNVSRSGNYRPDGDTPQRRPHVYLDNEFVSGGVLNAYTPEDEDSVVRWANKLERLVHRDSDAQFGRAPPARGHRRMMAWIERR